MNNPTAYKTSGTEGVTILLIAVAGTQMVATLICLFGFLLTDPVKLLAYRMLDGFDSRGTGNESMKNLPDDKLHPIESKYMAGAAVVGFLVTLLLTGGSLFAAFGALAMVGGVGWIAHRLLR